MSKGNCTYLQACLQDDLDPYLSMDHMDIKCQAATQLIGTLLKKNTDEIAKDADAKAIELFLEFNHRCKDWRPSLNFEHHSLMVGTMRQFLASLVHHNSFDKQFTYSLSAICRLGDFGPGASRGTRHTSYIGKISRSCLTATSQDIIDMWGSYTRTSARHARLEHRRSQEFGFKVVRASKFSCVPKTRAISRGIATEPSLNMFFQRGIGRCLDEALRIKTGLNPAKQQDKAKELARLGSATGQFSTIDLRSASDSLSLRLIYMLFPSDFCILLSKFRTKYTIVDGKEVKLFLCSSMGNGFTFSLQTAVFTAVVLAALKANGIQPIFPRGKSLGNFSVFGDDIIVPTKAYSSVLDLLRLIGCEPNETKSFGYPYPSFRESCGGDYFSGCNIRGVYNKTLSSPRYVYSTINLLVFWSARHRIPLLKTIGYLSSLVPIRFIVPSDAFMVSDGIMIYDFRGFRRDSVNDSYYTYVYRHRVISRSCDRYDVDAVVQTALKGALRHGKVVERQTSVVLKRVKVVSPSAWPSSAIMDMFLHGVSVSTWKRVVDWYW